MNPIKKSSLEKNILEEILNFVETRYKRIAINNHITIQDIRTYTWRQYVPEVRYTYIVDLTDIENLFAKFESRNKSDIKKSKKKNIEIYTSNDVGLFFDLHRLTFERQGLKCPVSYAKTEKIFSSLHNISKGRMYFAKDPHDNICSAIFIVWDNETAYYLMGASHPDFRNYGSVNASLWSAMQELAEIGIKRFDLYGANTASIAFFKRGFGGELRQYYRVIKYNSRLLLLGAKVAELFNCIKRN